MSNGQVERFVDTFKRAMKKCGQKKNWIEETLLAYRTTPNSALNGHSPDELFLGRHLRTRLTLVHPEGQKMSSKVDKEKFLKFQKANKQRMAQQFNAKNGSKEAIFKPGEPIFLLNYRLNKTFWLKGTIIERVKNSPTYRVKVPALGRDVHRHANQLRKRHPVEMDIRVGPRRGGGPRGKFSGRQRHGGGRGRGKFFIFLRGGGRGRGKNFYGEISGNQKFSLAPSAPKIFIFLRRRRKFWEF
uniref:Uncharacterized protein n=1 Tax=Meloidogyne enterolobii TaxID=390850 RepID=A0A6V7W7A6_MELEN|nr:unnamed protein product [Meloidogyne enterolobii]